MIRILEKSLYQPDQASWEKSLEYAKGMKEESEKSVSFHCLWKVPGEFGRKQMVVLKSILTAHCEILDRLEINLWSNVDLSENKYFQEVSGFVKLRMWNFEEEIKGTILDGEGIDSLQIRDERCYLESDIFRLLVLHKYGGFYIDMDVLVLRNMSPLNHLEFQYQWGTSGFNANEPNITINNAIMRLEKKSSTSLEFLEKVLATPGMKNSTSWGNGMSPLQKNDLLVLPGMWFNSEWGFENTTCNPFEKHDNICLFDGAYTWHWHNNWDAEIEEGSKFHILEKNISEKFEEMTKRKM
jgi:hypothetical protein